MNVDENILTTVYNKENQNAIFMAKSIAALSENHTATGTFALVQMGESCSVGDVCYLKSDGMYYVADSTDKTKKANLVLSTNDYRQYNTGLVLVDGYMRNDSWSWTVAADLYLGTSGDMTETIPSGFNGTQEHVGFAITSNIIHFRHNVGSNLSALKSALIPDTDDAYDIGHALRQWQDGWFDGTVNCDGLSCTGNADIINGNLKIQMDNGNTSNPPTDAELDAIWTSPATVGAGFIAFLNDGGSNTSVYLITSDGTNWWHSLMKKAT